MVLSVIRKAPEVIPLIVIVCGACTAGIGFTIRQAMKNPDASWDRRNNQHPWLNIKANEQVKLYSHTDYSQFENNRPSVEGTSES
ncbi:cytochrome c oxidase subunit NDUFA4-like [Montipora foliosa]|uniref:cytochrome c oxidase subunit NDUFA4-like n=1 Tax=Montipora foliosa TaxID=591990 RepID=UPI0035F17377